MKLELHRGRTDTRVWTPTRALTTINHRLANDTSTRYGWEGLGKAKLKLAAACAAPLTFKGASPTGFTWTRTNSTNPETYTGTITNVTCE